MCTDLVRLTRTGVVAVLLACGYQGSTEPAQLSPDQIVGTFRLTSLAWVASDPFRAMPTWTWPGRVLVLDGALEVRVDGRYVRSGHTRITMFGDTTFTAGADSGSWSLNTDTLWLRSDPRTDPEPARLSGDILTVYAGGFASGGTRWRYSRQ